MSIKCHWMTDYTSCLTVLKYYAISSQNTLFVFNDLKNFLTVYINVIKEKTWET